MLHFDDVYNALAVEGPVLWYGGAGIVIWTIMPTQEATLEVTMAL